MNQKCHIYSINNYVGKKRQIYNKIYVTKKNTKFTTSKFTSEKHMPNLQHQYLHEKKNRQICNTKIYVSKKNRQIYNIKIYARKKKRQTYNIKIYVRKKTAKLTTSKFTWEKKTPNLKHKNLRGKNNEKFTTSLTTSRTTLDVCQNIDRGRCLNQIIFIYPHAIPYHTYCIAFNYNTINLCTLDDAHTHRHVYMHINKYMNK